MDWNWIPFDQAKYAGQPLPRERRYVLCQVAEREEKGLPPSVAVGYLRFAAGDRDSPGFIVPGVGGPVVAWCDCLGDDFVAPLWPGTHKKKAAQP